MTVRNASARRIARRNRPAPRLVLGAFDANWRIRAVGCGVEALCDSVPRNFRTLSESWEARSRMRAKSPRIRDLKNVAADGTDRQVGARRSECSSLVFDDSLKPRLPASARRPRAGPCATEGIFFSGASPGVRPALAVFSRMFFQFQRCAWQASDRNGGLRASWSGSGLIAHSGISHAVTARKGQCSKIDIGLRADYSFVGLNAVACTFLTASPPHHSCAA